MTYHPLTHVPGTYREQHAFNASFLTDDQPKYADFSVGTEVDNYICYNEPPTIAKAKAACRAFDKSDIGKLISKAKADGLLQVQHEYYRFVEIAPGFKTWLKAKLDLVVRGLYNIDIKTTSASTAEEFTRHIKDFNYVRSQGHYHRMAGVRQSALLVISTKTNSVWMRPFTAEQMEEGAKAFDAALFVKLDREGFLI
jgi:hypothetical protein